MRKFKVSLMGGKVVIRANCNIHKDERNRGNKEVMERFSVQDRNAKGQMAVDFIKRLEIIGMETVFLEYGET